MAAVGTTWAAAPNFGPAIYADGEVWGTKGLSELPAPNGHNDQSFDKLFMFVNGDLEIVAGNARGGADYFLCPLLVVKTEM